MESNQHLGTYLEKRYLWWDSLSRLAGSAGLRRYTGLIFVVPVIAAGINAIGSARLHLPATLTLAYIAGLCFLGGILMVEAWCPDICRNGRTAAVTEAEGRTKQYILQQSRETYLALIGVSPSRANHFLRGLFAYYVPSASPEIDAFLRGLTDEPLPRPRVWQIIEFLVRHPPEFREAFWHVQWFAASSRKRERRTAAAFLGAGILFAALTVAFQAVAVWRAR